MKKKVTALGLLLGAIAVGAAAFAYYMGQGSGNGTIAKGGNAPLTLTIDIPADQIAAIYPGDSDGFVAQVANHSGHNAYVGGVAADTNYGTNGVSTSDETDCPASWFSLSGVGLATGETPGVLPDGGGKGVVGSLTFIDKPFDQSGCSGVSVSVGLVTTP